PRLRMPDEIHLGEFLQHAVKALEVKIVSLVLEMHQYWDVVLLRDSGDKLHRFGIAVHRELLFANPDRPSLQVLFEHLPCFRNVGQLVREEDILSGPLFRNPDHCVVSARSRGKPVFGARRQQDRLANPHRALVGKQLRIGTPAVVCVLMNVDDGFCGAEQSCGAQSRKSASRNSSRWLHPIQVIRRITRFLAPQPLRCRQAGPTGNVLYWQLTKLGVTCELIAPSLIPAKPGDRVKRDRWDAEKLARCYRASELTPVWVP